MDKKSIVIRDIQQFDSEDYFSIYSDPKVTMYDDFEPITREELIASMKLVETYRTGSLNREYAVALLPDNKMIGILTVDKKRKYIYLGYHFNPHYQGRGYALKSVMIFLEDFMPPYLSLVRLAIDPANQPSISLAVKAGFKLSGRRMTKGKPELVFKLNTLAEGQ